MKSVDVIGVQLMNKMLKRCEKKDVLSRVILKKQIRMLRYRFNSMIPTNGFMGENIYIAHPLSVVIGDTAEIGNNCCIYPGILVAAKVDSDAAIKKRRHAKIGNNVILGANSMIIGDVVIGDNVIIGAGAKVYKDIPSNSIVINNNEILINNHKNALPFHADKNKIINYNENTIVKDVIPTAKV